MKPNRSTLAAAACVLSLCALPVSAAVISGTITAATNGTPLSNIEVRLYQLQDKAWTVVQTTTSDGTGVYTLSGIADGSYKVFARMANGVGGNWGDEWFDQAPPMSNGYIGEDADLITLTTADTLNGIDFQLDPLGGFDGRTLTKVGNTPKTGIMVRAETAGDQRIHHNELTKTDPNHLAYFMMRGLPLASDYRFFARDLDALYTTAIAEPFSCTAGVTAVPPLLLEDMPADPNGVNDDSSAMDVDVSMLHMSPPSPWNAITPNISPRNTGDSDWYCFQAVDGDRLILTATSNLQVIGGTREDPWMDPIIGFFDGTGTTKLSEDDDSATDKRGAQLDTGELTAGRYCAVVSTYGDVNYTGTIQGSAGPYEFSILMGNRRPALSATVDGSPAPVSPDAITVDEGQTVTIEVAYSDIDGDPLAATGTMVDNAGNPVATAMFTAGANNGTFTWTADQTAAQLAPYTVRFTAADAEFTEVLTVGIAVNGVNLTPTLPVQIAPADGTSVMTDTPDLVVENATDGDNDPLTYEFELYYGDSMTPDQTGSAAEDPLGQTTWVPAAIPENTHVRWRVRAYDGQTDSPYSMWTGEWTFFVDTANDPPEAPVFLKPDDSETLNIRQPTLSASNPTDPEDDPIVMRFQLAKNAAFTEGLVESADLPLNTAGSSTMWTVLSELPWGSTWYARAYAKDNRGGVSPMSNYHVFVIRSNVAPAPPVLGTPFDATCQNLEIKETTLTSVSVLSSSDPEMEPVTLQLRIIPGEGDPNTVMPLYDETQPQTADVTAFDTSAVQLTEDARYRVQARAYDGTDYSEWSQCDFVINADGGGGDGDGNNGGDPSVKEGCGCGATDGSALTVFGALALVAAGMRRRRRNG